MSRFIRFRYVRLRVRLQRFLLPNPLPPSLPPSGTPPTLPPALLPPGFPSGRVRVVLKFLSILVALSGLLMTFFLARSGHDTAGLVAVLSALAPLLVVTMRSR